MKPTKEELATLSRADLDSGKVPFQDRNVVEDPETPDRLIQNGLCEKDGTLTDTGKKLAVSLQDRLKVLRKGVSMDKRKAMDNKKLCTIGEKWVAGAIKTKEYITNGELWIYAKPWARMNVSQASPEFRKYALPMVQKALKGTKGDFAVVTPKWWQLFEINGLEVIWLESKDGSISIPVQSAYYDFIVSKYPSSTFIVNKSKADNPVIVRVQKRGVFKDVIALIQPLVPGKNVVKPGGKTDEGTEE